MGRHTRHGMDDQPLEGGGRGAGGGSSFKDVGLPLAGIGSFAGAAKMTMDAVKDKADKEHESKKDSMTPGQKQSMEEAKDEEMRKKMKDAPTTKTEMGKPFAKGGTASSRADGIAQRGKTRGKMI
jgi:hypothetical protein